MSYAMRKTPRSSFMGDVTSSVVTPLATPLVVSPPFNPNSPSGVMPMTPPAAAPSGLGQYVLWGGIAYLAYWLWSKE